MGRVMDVGEGVGLATTHAALVLPFEAAEGVGDAEDDADLEEEKIKPFPHGTLLPAKCEEGCGRPFLSLAICLLHLQIVV